MFSGKKGHLASTDAEFVDVIHTDGGVFGFPIALGDADFFPNGGFPAQPGCRINALLQKNQIKRIRKFPYCSFYFMYILWSFFVDKITSIHIPTNTMYACKNHLNTANRLQVLVLRKKQKNKIKQNASISFIRIGMLLLKLSTIFFIFHSR